MKKSPLLLAVILVAGLAGAVLWYRHQQSRPPSEAPPATAAQAPGSRTAPPFALPDINGNVVSSDRYAGKPLVINFFATWCPPCRQEIPGFVDVYNKYRGQGLEVVGISLDTDTRGNLPGFVAANRIEYRILFGDIPTARAYGGVSSIPTTFFVGKDGGIKNVHVGYLDRDAFEQEVRKLL